MVDPVLADTLWQALRADGITAPRASDSNAVMRMARANPPSLVVLERYLPGIDGLATSRALRDQIGLSDDVPIIMVSSQTDDAGGAAAGVTDWLVKPFSAIYARTRLRAWLLRTACRWAAAPLPPDEDKRLASLHSLHILDTPPEERFDKLTRIAASLFNVPVALVSLIDANRQWFKSAYGTNVCESSRDVSFCAHAILQHEVMIIPDALRDSRFADNPVVVDEPRVRFYAGCPLVLPDGSCIGTLCLIDMRPRMLDETEVKLLQDLAGLVRHELLHPSEERGNTAG
jgi:CheY-like chemotaxis protein